MDVLTKSLSKVKFVYFRDKLDVVPRKREWWLIDSILVAMSIIAWDNSVGNEHDDKVVHIAWKRVGSLKQWLHPAWKRVGSIMRCSRPAWKMVGSEVLIQHEKVLAMTNNFGGFSWAYMKTPCHNDIRSERMPVPERSERMIWLCPLD